jgi:hypothetical protein
MDPSLPPPREEPRVFQNAQVPRDGGRGDVEGRREVSHGGFRFRQTRENRAARRIGERGEGSIERRRIVNH